MNKKSYIQTISSYIDDGFVVVPAGARNDLEANGMTIGDLNTFISIARDNLDALIVSKRLIVIPEGILNNFKSFIESSRETSSDLSSREYSTAQNALSNIINLMEQVIAQSAPYLNLADSTNYKSLDIQARDIIQELSRSIIEEKKQSNLIIKSVSATEKKSKNLLERISSGVLSENFKRLSNSKWNFALMSLALLATVYAFAYLVMKSNEISNYMIDSLVKNNLDHRLFLLKWSTSLPYLLLLSVALFELRNRIRNRDTYLYRENVAGSLDGYTESLLNKVEEIKSPQERDKVRSMVIEFMIDSMLELTKSPNIKSDKQSLGVKLRDIGEANITN